MTTLHLQWPVEDQRLCGVRVPVTVRTPALALVHETEAPGTVELAPGLYVLSARLPAGQELTRVVRVEAGEPRTVELTPDESSLRELIDYLASPREREAAVRAAVEKVRSEVRDDSSWRRRVVSVGASVLGGLLGSLLPSWTIAGAEGPAAGPDRGPMTSLPGKASRSRPSAALPPQGWLRGFVADPLLQEALATPIDLGLEVIDQRDDVAELRVGASVAPRYVQVLQPGRPPVNLALPTSAESGCRIVVRREPVRYWVEVQVENIEAGLLLAYRRNASAREEARVAEGLLTRGGESRDPVPTALAAYSCLRFGDLDRLVPWSEALRTKHEWLPDGAAIDGERLALEGEHERALDAFLEATERGLPRFSDGIDTLHRRLEFYTDLPEDFEPEMIERAGRRLDRLRAVVGLVDLGQVVTVLTGLDPNRPDAEPYTLTLPGTPEGFHLAELFL